MQEMISALIAAKEQQGLTNQQISEMSGVALGTVGRVFSGAADDPKFQTICQLAAALKVSLDGTMFKLDQSGQTKVVVPQASESDKVVNILRDVIYRQQKEKRILFACLMLMIVFVMTILIIDLTDPNVGWFRSALESIRGLFGTDSGNIVI